MPGFGWMLWCVGLQFGSDEIGISALCVFLVLAGGGFVSLLFWQVLGQEIRAVKVKQCGNYD